MPRLARKFRTASFKGIQFRVESVDTDLGRRVVTHEYPLRDLPNSEDLGRKSRIFSIEGYVLGSTYEADRDRLVAACEESGIGQLVHPYLGTKNVVCVACKVREGRTENGIAYFSLSFIEAGQSLFPRQTTDPLTKILGSGTGSKDAAENQFAKKFTVASAPSYVVDSAVSKVENFADVVESFADKSRANIQAIADFTYKIRNLKATVRDIVQTPSKLAKQLRSAIEGLTALTPDNKKATKAALYGSLSSYGKDFPPIPDSTFNRRREKANADALKELNKLIGTADYATTAAADDYGSQADASKERELVTDLIDDILFTTDDDDVFDNYQGLRNDSLKSIPNPDSDIPNLTNISLLASTPSLVLVYDLYNDLSLEAGLISRNKIRNPAFIPGSKTLEVLQLERL